MDPIRSLGASIGPASAIRPQWATPPALATDAAGGGSFSATLSRALGDIQRTQVDAGATVEAFLRGEPVELHDVMAAVEEAGIALEMLIQVRDRLVEAYRTVANMQG